MSFEEFPHFWGSLLSLSDVAEAVGLADRLKTRDWRLETRDQRLNAKC